MDPKVSVEMNQNLIKQFTKEEVEAALKQMHLTKYPGPDDGFSSLINKAVGNNKGVFTVKGTYYVALNIVESPEEGEKSYNDPREHLWKKIWHLHIPSKVRISAWRACVDALPTMGLLDISDVALKILMNGTDRDLEVFFGVAWSIWYNSNQMAFESKCQLPSQIWSYAWSFHQDYRGALVTLNMSPTAKNNRWTPPPLGVFKINVDGATSEDGRNSSVGAIIRDSCGAVIAAYGKYLQGQFSIAEMEALVVESRILLARDISSLRLLLNLMLH
ncbi:hypothetical protein SO802_015033 [Lithocarpus litseifolius]|uniref:RNase H type-1 domain-containing protein n=1 Tax=Lithocarpus litseifolius TaxID=425828 RepID=A0AAW2CSL0_9ROSI